VIPLNTRPGAEIVCINAESHREYGPVPLGKGEIYVLREWVPCKNELGIKLDGIEFIWRNIDVAFSPSRFRLLEIHQSLLALQTQRRYFSHELVG
jgi:hypothetical protein